MKKSTREEVVAAYALLGIISLIGIIMFPPLILIMLFCWALMIIANK
jgi:hypothetical protein